MANNYTPQYEQYMAQTGAVLPSTVRTYSVFDPSSNSWRRMTNDGKSPIPVQGQTVVPVQSMTPTQTPGILLRPKVQQQAPVYSGQRRVTPSAAPKQTNVKPPVVVQQAVVEPDRFRATVSPDHQTPSYPAQPVVLAPTGSRVSEVMPKYAAGSLLPDLRDAVLATKFGSDPTEIELGQSVPVVEHAPVLDGTIAPYSFGGNAPKADPALTAKTLGAMGALIGTGGAAALGVGPLALLGTVGRGALSTGGRMLGSAGTLGGKVINPVLQRGKGLVDWAKAGITRTKPSPDWQTPL